jgi:hypothetical protein
MKELTRSLVRTARVTPVASYQRFGYLIAALLALSGVFHFVVYLVAGGPWEGPVSWRKPIVFGLSFGITLGTLTWFMSFLRPRQGTGWIAIGVLAVASLGEVALISMQRWRGVPSHFNESTSFDGLVFSAMGMLVAVVALVTVFVAIRSFFHIDASASLAWAIRAGLVLMLVSQAVGVQMIVEGSNTFGTAGALKVPHAFTLHVAQVLPALALVLSASAFSERRRLRVVALGAAGYAGLIASTMVQAYGGRGPLDLGVVSAALAVAGFTTLVASAVIAVHALRSRGHISSKPPVGPPPDASTSALPTA